MARHVRLPESIQVKETLGESFGGCHVATVTAVGEGVAAAQTQPVTEVLVQLGVRRQTGLLPADGGVWDGEMIKMKKQKNETDYDSGWGSRQKESGE